MWLWSADKTNQSTGTSVEYQWAQGQQNSGTDRQQDCRGGAPMFCPYAGWDLGQLFLEPQLRRVNRG